MRLGVTRESTVLPDHLHWGRPLRPVRRSKGANRLREGRARKVVRRSRHQLFTVRDAHRGGRTALFEGGNHFMKPLPMLQSSEQELREKEAQYCSYGDTVHYSPAPKFFQSCEGSFLYDRDEKPYLDLQMWYSAVNFGYRNKVIVDALKTQLERLPQLACQYLHEEKVLLSEKLARESERAFGLKGRIQLNVGGAQAIEDSMKLVRNATGKSLFMAFTGGYHGRTLGASEITSSYRYRRRFGHFSNRAHFVPYPYCYRCPYGKTLDSCDYYCVNQVERLFETEYNSFWDSRANEPEFVAFYVEPVQATGGYIIPPPEYLSRLARILADRKILLVDDEIQMGFFRTGKFWAIEHFGVTPDKIGRAHV